MAHASQWNHANWIPWRQSLATGLVGRIHPRCLSWLNTIADRFSFSQTSLKMLPFLLKPSPYLRETLVSKNVQRSWVAVAARKTRVHIH